MVLGDWLMPHVLFPQICRCVWLCKPEHKEMLFGAEGLAEEARAILTSISTSVWHCNQEQGETLHSDEGLWE